MFYVIEGLAVALIIVTGLALYRGWFSLWGRTGSPWSIKDQG